MRWWPIAICLFSACFPSVERGACESSKDCEHGLVCSPTLGLCVRGGADSTCARACGAGFRCELSAAGEHCAVMQGTTAEVALAAPATGARVGSGVVEITCEASAPQLRTVRAVATQGETHLELPPTSAGDEGTWKTTLDATHTPEGEYEVACEVEYGPTGDTVVQASASARVVIDHTAPAITITPPAGPFAPLAIARVHAVVADPHEGRVEPGSVVLRLGEASVDGVAADASSWDFDVTIPSTRLEGPGDLAFVVEAADGAGNVARSEGKLRVDPTPPIVTIAPDETWRARAGAAFTVTATITTDEGGAELANGSVVLEVAQLAPIAGVALDGRWTFTLEPARLAAEDFEGEVPLRVRARDTAGNEGSASATRKVDGKGPTISWAASEEWHARGPVVPITVEVADKGMGVDAGQVKVSRASGAPVPCVRAGLAWTCEVETANAPAGVNTPSHPFTVTATDTGGNATSASGSLRIDAKAPVVSIAADSAWYGSAPITVAITATDAGGSGVAAVRLEPADSAMALVGAAAVQASPAAEGEWRATFDPAAFAKPGRVHPAFALRAVATDHAGLETIATTTRNLDGVAPTITLTTLPAGSIRRAAPPVTIVARVADDGPTVAGPTALGAGVDAASVVLRYVDRAGAEVLLPGTQSGADSWSFQLDPSLPKFDKGAGAIDGLQVRASDRVGLAATPAPATVNVTRLVWQFDTLTPAGAVGAPAVAGDLVYFALKFQAATNHNLYALERAPKSTGQYRWSHNLAAQPQTAPVLGGSLLYVGSDLAATGASGRIHAFNAVATGLNGELWNCGLSRTGATAATPANGLALTKVAWTAQEAAAETVFAATKDGGLVALRRNAGNTACELRAKELGTDGPAGGTVAIGNGAAFLTSAVKGNVLRVPYTTAPLAFGATGKTADVRDAINVLPGVALTATSAVAAYPPFVVRVNAQTLADQSRRASVTGFAGPILSPPVLASDTLAYWGSDDRHVFGANLGATATEVMSFATSSPVRGSPVVGRAPVGSTGQVVYAATADGKVLALNADGSKAWDFDASSGGLTGIESSPALDCKGVLFVVNGKGRAHAIQTDSPGLAGSPWPRFQHDSRNTGDLANALVDANGACVEP